MVGYEKYYGTILLHMQTNLRILSLLWCCWRYFEKL